MRVEFALVVLALSVLAVSTPTGGAEPVSEEGDRIALVVFLSYQGQIPLAIPPAHMRRLGNELLSARLESLGHQVISYSELEPIMQERRIRSSTGLDLGFLHALGDRHAVDRVLVSTFVIYPDRLVVLSRGIEIDNGWLVSASVAEELAGDLWGDPEEAWVNWESVVTRTSMTVADGWEGSPPDSTSGTLIVLPVIPIGISAGQAAMATYNLLDSVLETNRWSVPDPVMVVSGLHADGYHPASLETEARRELATRFSAESILISSLMSFDQAPPRVIAPLFEDDDFVTLPHQLESTVPVHLSILVVDSTTGDVLAGDAEYLEPEDPQGLFGIPNDIRVATRLKKGTDRLMRILPTKGADS